VDNHDDQALLQELVTIFKDEVNGVEEMGATSLSIHIVLVPFSEKFEPSPRPKVMDRITFSCTSIFDILKFQDTEFENTWKIAVGEELNAENIYLFHTEHDAFIFMHAQAR
jgi:hypothetical protein